MEHNQIQNETNSAVDAAQQSDISEVILKHESVEDLFFSDDKPARIAAQDQQAAVEALLFVAGDPLPFEKIRQITGMDKSALEQVLQDMTDRYARDRNRGIMLREAEGKFSLSTKPGFHDVAARLYQPRHRPPLSQAAYETLAVIAYNQPVTRAQIEAVRGVNCDSIISRLLERNLITEAGTLDAPGRPTLFKTTEQFLLDVGLRSVEDLPPMEMLMYGTLRDMETSLEEASGTGRDNQITIDQLVDHFVDPDADHRQSTRPDVSEQ